MIILPTNYRGITFRSRQEARFAVFLSDLSIPFEYEPNGFAFKNGAWYLPDFYLPKQECYVEIKGKKPLPHELQLCQWLCENTNTRVFLRYPSDLYSENALAWIPQDGLAIPDSRYWWCECPTCGQLDLQFEGRAGNIRICDCTKNGKQYNYDTPRLNDAYNAARNERFGIHDLERNRNNSTAISHG